MKMKNVLFAMIGMGMLAVTPSCKKGENDPFLSLSSRKARMAGEYEIDSWVTYTKETDPDGVVTEETTDLSGASGTQITKTTDGGSTVTTTKNIVVDQAMFSFTKDGTWESEFNTTTTWTEEGGGWLVDEYHYTVVETMTESGTWSFLGGQPEDYKNKERVMLNVLESESTSQTTTETDFTDGSSSTETGDLYGYEETNASGEYTMVYMIDMLKGKELVLKQDLTGEYSNSTTSGGVTSTFTVMQSGEVEIQLTEE